MKEEIKERIKYFKHYVVDNLSLDAQDDFQKILDYITNLQEEIKELKEDKSKMFETAVKNNNKLMDKIYNAIEYIDNNFDFDKLLEILKGSEKK